MHELVAAARMVHRGPRHHLVLVLIDDKALLAEDASDLILLLFSADEEDLILGLNRAKVIR